MFDEKASILDLSLLEWQDLLRSLGQPAFRARQIFEWIYRGYVLDFERMTNLPKSLRAQLQSATRSQIGEPIAECASADGSTAKALLRLHDGQTIESVLMLQESPCDGGIRRSVCVSTQVGCPVGCSFCATGQSGFVRHLSAGEMVAQVLHFASRTVAAGPERPITSVVFMGQGEPLLNLAQTRQAIETLNSPYGFGLGARHITVSTAGVVPGILELARWPLQVGLALSLHAPSDDLRSELVPLNRRYPITRLLEACQTYSEATGRRVTFEYTLIAGVNDGLQHARELARRIRDTLCHVNLIPFNPIPSSAFTPTPRGRVLAFQAELLRRGIPCTVRVERGGDIDAACGQLRRRSGTVNRP